MEAYGIVSISNQFHKRQKRVPDISTNTYVITFADSRDTDRFQQDLSHLASVQEVTLRPQFMAFDQNDNQNNQTNKNTTSDDSLVQELRHL